MDPNVPHESLGADVQPDMRSARRSPPTLFVATACISGTAGCSGRHESAFDDVWKAFLGRSLPLYLLGTSTWPVASLLAKWQSTCGGQFLQQRPSQLRQENATFVHHKSGPTQAGSSEPNSTASALCAQPEVLEFLMHVEAATQEHLMPLLWRPKEKAGAAEVLLGLFVSSTLRPLTAFMNSAPRADPDFWTACAAACAAEGAALLLIRLLGTPVPRDPLDRPRLTELAKLVAHMPFATISETSAVFSAAIAASHYVAWRSHDLFLDVKLDEVRRVLGKASEQVQESLQHCSGCGLLQSFHEGEPENRLRFWEAVAGADLPPLWRQVCRWLLSRPTTRAEGTQITQPSAASS
eukprot:s4069_g2.t1